jgi:sugar lactone lactonase YvrE
VLFTHHYSRDELKEALSWASGTNGEEEKCIEGFVLDILNERGHLEDLGIDGNCAEDSGFWVCHTVSTGSRRRFEGCNTFFRVDHLSKSRRIFTSRHGVKKRKLEF